MGSASWRTSALVIAVLLAFTATHVALAWETANSKPWLLNSDHFVLGSLHYKGAQPELYSRDYLLNNEESYAYYTPSFMQIVDLVAQQVDGNYLRTLALLQGPILAFYLIATFLLLKQVSNSSLVAILLALASVRGFYSLKDYWSVVGLETVLARTIALPTIMTAGWFFVRALLASTPSWRLWLATGVFIGVSAILHPVTGITFALVIGLTTLVSWKRIVGRRTLNLALLVVATCLASLPILVHTFQHSGGKPVTDFPAFAAAFSQRVSMFPFDSGFGRIIGFQDSQQLLIGFLWLPLSLLSWYAMKTNQRSWTVWPYILCQMLYVWLLVDQPANHLNIVSLIGIYYAWRWWRRAEEEEIVWLHLIGSIVFVSFTFPVLLRALWLQFELTPLTTLLSQLPRGARFLTFPVLIIAARLARDLLSRWKTMPATVIWIELVGLMSVIRLEQGLLSFLPLLLLLALRFQQVTWQTSHPFLFAAWLGMTVQISVVLLVGDGGLVAQGIGAITVGLTWFWLRNRPAKWLVFLSAGMLITLMGAVLVLPALNRLDTSKREAVITALEAVRNVSDSSTSVYLFVAVMLGAGLYLMFRNDRGLNSQDLTPWLLVPVLIAISLQCLEAIQGIERTSDAVTTPPEAYILGEWARENTDQDALFFPQGVEGAEFRFWSRRSITMSHKDLGVFVAFSRQSELATLTNRWLHLVSVRGDALVEQARAMTADFIITLATDKPLALPIAFQTPSTIVYSVAADQDTNGKTINSAQLPPVSYRSPGLDTNSQYVP